MKKKLLTLGLVAAMLLTSAGATLAYFTDSEQATNEFTVGNVAIDLYETVKHTDTFKKDGVNVEHRVYINEQTLGEGTDTNPGIEYTNIQPSHKMTKIAHVKNTGDNDAYVALVIKQENYLNFNRNIDDYYESNENHVRNADWWKSQGIELEADADYNNNTVMQKITDDVFPNWNLLYNKNSISGNNNMNQPLAQVRYTMDALPTAGEGVKVLGVGYAQENTDMSGDPQYHYSGAYFTNVVGQQRKFDGEPDFFTISDAGEHDRVWIVYLMMAPGAKFDMDLTTVCPTYFDNDSTKAFENMTLDIKAFAIQSSGFASDKDGQKAAFAEVLKADDVFAY